MSKYKEHIYITMLRKRGTYICHHLDKMQEGTLKVLRDRTNDSSLRQIKSIFGVYEILLLQIVNDLKFSQLEQFATGIQKLFKQVIASSLYFVKGLLKSIQKNYQSMNKQSNQAQDKPVNADEEILQRRIYQFKQKFYFNLNQQVKADIDYEDPQSNLMQKLHQQIQTVKQGILNSYGQKDVVSAATYLQQIMNHFNQSTHGSKIILETAQNDLKMSDDQLKQTENIHNLLEKVVQQKQRKMKSLRKTLLLNQLAPKKTMVNEFTQTQKQIQQDILKKQPKKTQKYYMNNKENTHTSQQSQKSHHQKVIQNHELSQQLIVANKRIQTLSSKALQLKQAVSQKVQQIKRLEQIIARLENPQQFTQQQNKNSSNQNSEQIQITSFKQKKWAGFKKRLLKTGYNKKEDDQDIEQLIKVSTHSNQKVQIKQYKSVKQVTIEQKDDLSKYSFLWQIIYDMTIVNKPNITKQQFVETVQQQIVKNNVKVVVKQTETKLKKSSSLKKKRSTKALPLKYQKQKQVIIKPKAVGIREPPKTATVGKRNNYLRNSDQITQTKNNYGSKQKIYPIKSVDRIRVRHKKQTSAQHIVKVQDEYPFGPQFKMVELKTFPTTFTSFFPNQRQSVFDAAWVLKPNHQILRSEPKTLQLQFQQDKYIIKLYRKYAQFRISHPQQCFKIVNTLGLTQIHNRGFIGYDEFLLQTSRYIDKHRHCKSKGDGLICNHLVQLSNTH